MKILGFISYTHDCGVSLVENNEIKGCFSEERFNRIKTANDTTWQPNLSLKFIQDYFNFNINDEDVTLATSTPIFIYKENSSINPFIYDMLNTNKNIHVYPHHYCHALSTYLTSGFKNEKVLNIVFDGAESNNVDYPCILNKNNYTEKSYAFRNSNYCSVYSCQNGSIEKILNLEGYPKSVKTGRDLEWSNGWNPITGLWYHIMSYFNFKPLKDEGKIMGLAAQGKYNKSIYDNLKHCFEYKNLKFNIENTLNFYLIMEHLNKNFDFKNKKDYHADLAYCLQKLTEDTMIQFISDLYKKFPGHTKLCLSGGLFANVKLNQRINEYLPFEEIYIMPPMSDEGISLGAALAHSYNLDPKKCIINRWDNVFLGIGYTQETLDKSIDLSIHRVESYDPKIVAKLLVDGKVVGTFQNRSEYGPRALGARSIMVEPTKAETHVYINKKLNRNEIMPFAPIIMSEYISDICYAHKSIRSAEFMTLCYTVKDEWKHVIPAVINTYDNTARPQVVFKERNTFFHDILSEFYNLTGIPVLMNTSFNSHGEPIINHPDHAIDHLNKGSVDYLILGNKLISKI